mmetsp:Transcript_7046/g.18076  ORF Transcript_7046/g.18076 Transcript_7046/m.18076 type:complete len:308 (+) Transcript_7046:1138-2061(+)
MPLVHADLFHPQERPLASFVVEGFVHSGAYLEDARGDFPRVEGGDSLRALVPLAEHLVEKEHGQRPEGPLDEGDAVEAEHRVEQPVERVGVPEDVKADDLLPEDFHVAAPDWREGGDADEEHAGKQDEARDAVVAPESSGVEVAVVGHGRQEGHPGVVHRHMQGDGQEGEGAQVLVEVYVAVQGQKVDGWGLAEHRHEVAHHGEEQQREDKVEDVAANLGERQPGPHSVSVGLATLALRRKLAFWLRLGLCLPTARWPGGSLGGAGRLAAALSRGSDAAGVALRREQGRLESLHLVGLQGREPCRGR